MGGQLVMNLSARPGKREGASLPPPIGLAMAGHVPRRDREHGVSV